MLESPDQMKNKQHHADAKAEFEETHTCSPSWVTEATGRSKYRPSAFSSASAAPRSGIARLSQGHAKISDSSFWPK
jgi:hypothetical protein